MEVIDSYVPNSWQKKFHQSHARHKACVGGLGGGKSAAAIQEIKTCLVEHPGSVWVIGRKFLPSLRDTTLRAFLANIPQQLIRSYNKASLTLTLKNGSEVWFRPLYDPEILKSYEIAGFMIDEVNEVDKEIYDRLKDRMRQKLPNGGRPRYQSIICMNPTEEDHWVPQLFLHEKPPNHEHFTSSTFQNMENLPPEYISELETMYSKDVLQRFLYGQYGKVHKGRPVFPQFVRGNYIRPVAYDPKLPLIRGWDFGFNHPVCMFMQMEGSQVRVLGEVMGKKVYLDDFVEDHVLPYQAELFKKPLRVIDYCDPKGSDQSDKGRTSVSILNDKKIYPIYRKSFIKEGVMAIKNLLDTVNPDGNPNLLVHPRCKVLIEGLKGGYYRADGSEEPEKDGYYDHCFAAGTLVTTDRGLVPIENITTHDRVLTRGGYQRVLKAWCSGTKEVIELTFSDGRTITCTPDHKIWTENRGWAEAGTLTRSDMLVTDRVWKNLSTKEPLTDDIRSRRTPPIDSTFALQDGAEGQSFCIVRFGRSITDAFRRAITSTTRMVTLPITTSLISSAFPLPSITLPIPRSAPFAEKHQSSSSISKRSESSLKSGTPPRLDTNGTKLTTKRAWRSSAKRSLRNAWSAARTLWSTFYVWLAPSSVEAPVALEIFDVGTVQLVDRSRSARPVPVFDLTVETHHEFFASGILVSNCMDAFRYSVIHLKGLRRAQIYSETQPKVWINPRTGRRIEY